MPDHADFLHHSFDDAQLDIQELGGRELMQTILQQLPLPVFLVDKSGVIRYINQRACTLLSIPSGYAAGKRFSVFVDFADRSHLAEGLSEATPPRGESITTVKLLRHGRHISCQLLLAPVDMPEESDVLIAMIGLQPQVAIPSQRNTLEEPSAGNDDIAAAIRRLDVVSDMTNALLDDNEFIEPVLLRRAAGLLLREFADWVVVDMRTHGRLRRGLVMAKDAVRTHDRWSALSQADPNEAPLPIRVAQTGSLMTLPHIDDLAILGLDQDGNPLTVALSATSLLAVPIQGGNDILGVITLVRSANQSPFTFAETGLIAQLCRHVGMAVRADRNFRRRSEVADALQSSLLPRRLPDLPGMEVAGAYIGATIDVDVGGDFYDVYPSGEGWALVLGDVCGKGEQAATVTAAVRYAMRVLGLTESHPDEVLRQVNRFLRAQHDTDRFVTAVAAQLHWQGHSVRAAISSAGHPPALVLRDNGEVSPLRGGGRPLGLLEDACPSLTRLKLRAGDTLVMYSDGVTEARDEAGQTFGEDRLAEVLVRHVRSDPQKLVNSVTENIEQMCAGRLRDDVSLLAVRVCEPVTS